MGFARKNPQNFFRGLNVISPNISLQNFIRKIIIRRKKPHIKGQKEEQFVKYCFLKKVYCLLKERDQHRDYNIFET